MKAGSPAAKSAGDYMAAAIDIMVHTHEIDPRSPAADARLDWGEPWTLEQARKIFANAGYGALEETMPGDANQRLPEELEKELEKEKEKLQREVGAEFETLRRRLAGATLALQPAACCVTVDQINNWFPEERRTSQEQRLRMETIIGSAHMFAITILSNTPPGDDQTAAIQTVREAVSWAREAIEGGE